MEAAVPVPDEGGRRTAEGEGKEGLSLDLGCHHPHKLIRSDSCPFRAMSRSPATDHAAERAAPSGGAGPPLSSHTLVGGRGWTAVFSHSDSSDAYGTPMALLQPLVTSFNPRGLGSGDATLQLCSPFTAAQWQELHRQALIFKYMMASTPLPLELLFSPRPLVDGHSLVSNYGAVGRGGDYLNLRVTGTNGDPEPGRCRRTDGKKWRCSRGVVPGQKYCERHVHRARPRSRKPVELDRTAGAPAAVANGVYSTISASVNHATSATTTSPSSAAARHCTHSPPGVVPRGPDLKFPFHFMVPQDKKLRYAGSGGGDAEAQATTHQWQLLRAKMGLTNTTSALWQQHQDVQLNLNDHHACPFPSTHISSLRHPAEPSDQRDIPRWFIDAWSREHPFHGPATNICDNKDNSETTDKSGCRDVSPSNLTLSMSGTCGSDSDDHDQFPQAQFQMGLRLADAGKMLAPSWMSPVSAIGGPLAEVLQASSTVSFGKEHPGHHSDVTRGTAAGLIDLMSKTSYDSESTSPRESETRGFSSPTRVLHKALASLSDSSSNSSATFGPGPWPELGLQWGSPSTSRRTD